MERISNSIKRRHDLKKVSQTISSSHEYRPRTKYQAIPDTRWNMQVNVARFGWPTSWLRVFHSLTHLSGDSQCPLQVTGVCGLICECAGVYANRGLCHVRKVQQERSRLVLVMANNVARCVQPGEYTQHRLRCASVGVLSKVSPCCVAR